MLDLRLSLLACASALALAGCAAVGPNFDAPKAATPDDWTSWRSADVSLRIPVDATKALPEGWWQTFGDPVLDGLEQRAAQASPDLRTAALRYQQARAQRVTTQAQRGPEVNASAGATRQAQSENGASTRLLGVLGADPSITEKLAAPFTLYQAGFDASWEPDLWGRVGRAIEAADADVAQRTALLDLARLSLASDVARNYLELRTTQRQIRLMREDISALGERLEILQARADGGVIDHTDLERQRSGLAALQAQLPGLLVQESASASQVTLLLGERPGALQAELAPRANEGEAHLPDLANMGLGFPSEVALRRPDIRAAEARLHNAVASVGMATADLYPSIRLGAKFGYESYLSGEFSDWGSRAWSIGPSISLPIFDHGRRKSIVQLRGLQQQEAAVSYQQTVLKAWQEIDDALTAYTAERQQAAALQARARSAADAYGLVRARYQGGVTDFTAVLDTQREDLQARRDLTASQGRLATRYVTINRVLGNIAPASALQQTSSD